MALGTAGGEDALFAGRDVEIGAVRERERERESLGRSTPNAGVTLD